MSHVWIDLDNAPHVPFFAPILRELENRGHTVEVTARDYGYTLEMVRDWGRSFEAIGVHPGGNKIKKVVGLLDRAWALRRWAKNRKIDVAVSHGSRGLVVAARSLGHPSLTLYDYEFVQTAIFNRLSTRLMVPEALGPDCLCELGISEKSATYPGFKEEVYLGDFEPDGAFASEFGLDERVVVVLRPPATTAHYHNSESEAILDGLFQRIAANENILALVAPRTHEQAERIDRLGISNVQVLHKPVDGLNLLHHADLVISGGGTMNREAALMDVPTYSIFMGRVGALDRSLAERGRLQFIRSVPEVEQIRFEKKPPPVASAKDRRARAGLLIDAIIHEIESIART